MLRCLSKINHKNNFTGIKEALQMLLIYYE